MTQWKYLLGVFMVVLVARPAMGQRVEEEAFQDAAATPPSFTNPFFSHSLGRGAAWSIIDLDGGGDLWLRLENDNTNISFNLGPDESVLSVSLRLRILSGTMNPRVTAMSETGQFSERFPAGVEDTISFSATDQIPEIGLDGNPTGWFFDFGPVAEIRVIPADGAVGIDDVVAHVEAPCRADWDGNQVVDVFDLLAYLAEWFPAAPTADLTFDEVVDVFDLLAFLDQWFIGCG